MRRFKWALFASLVLALSACSGESGSGDSDSDGGVDQGTPTEAQGLTNLIISPQSAQLTPGVPQQFTALGEYATGQVKVLTNVAQWSTDNPEAVEIGNDADNKGLAMPHELVRVTITAKVGAIETSLTLGHDCLYPEDYTAQITPGEVAPPFGFMAYDANHQEVEFLLEDFACDDRYETVHFLLGTGWCGSCSALASRVGAEGQAIEEAGGLVIYVELEDADSNPIDSAGAAEHYDRLIQTAPGLRAGDLSSLPSAGFMGTAASGVIDGWPTTFSIRRRDMRVIAVDQPFLAVSQDPDRDWTVPYVPDFEDHCVEGDEEDSEPNDTPDDAAPLAVGESRGGICTAAGDFYQIDIEGPWRFTMTFDGGLADLDVFAWDVAQDGPLQQNGQPVGSAGTQGTERFEYQGPALVQVFGFHGASAPYTINLEAL